MRETTKDFLAYIKSTDKFQLRILFIHLSFESLMNVIFEYYFKNGKKLSDEKYSSKVNILQATGLIDDDIIHNLRTVNKMRNIIAHDLFIPHSSIEKLIKEIKINDRIRNHKKMNINKELEDVFVYIYDKLDVVVGKLIKKLPKKPLVEQK